MYSNFSDLNEWADQQNNKSDNELEHFQTVAENILCRLKTINDNDLKNDINHLVSNVNVNKGVLFGVIAWSIFVTSRYLDQTKDFDLSENFETFWERVWGDYDPYKK